MSASTLKQLGLVCTILIVLWIAYLYRQIPHGKAPFAKAADAATQIVRREGSKTVHLSKDGSSWQVELSSGGMTAPDISEVKELISALKEVQIEDEISDRADRASEFEVDEASGTRIILEDAKGGILAEGIFGKLASDAMHIYLRYPDKPNVYLARGIFPDELGKADPETWRRREQAAKPEPKIKR